MLWYENNYSQDNLKRFNVYKLSYLGVKLKIKKNSKKIIMVLFIIYKIIHKMNQNIKSDSDSFYILKKLPSTLARLAR